LIDEWDDFENFKEKMKETCLKTDEELFAEAN